MGSQPNAMPKKKKGSFTKLDRTQRSTNDKKGKVEKKQETNKIRSSRDSVKPEEVCFLCKNTNFVLRTGYTTFKIIYL